MTISPTQAAEFLSAHDRYLILTHVRPDGDTVGCAAALCRALRTLGKTAHVLPNPEITPLFSPYLEGLLAPEDLLPDTVVSVDMAARSLFPDNALPYLPRVDLAIDHHPSQEFFARETCLDAGAAACGEIIYRICRALDVMNAAIAKQLYIAITTDCGCFVYNNTTPETHRIAAELMTYGDFWQQVNRNCFQTVSLKTIRLQNRLLESMEFYDDGHLAVGAISQKDMDELQASQGDSEELAAWAKKIQGVNVSATLRQLDERVWKVSLRTDGSLNATKACGILGGGGHAAAAGATMRDVDEAEARAKVLAAIRAVQQEG